jgi:hypothetical protein
LKNDKINIIYFILYICNLYGNGHNKMVSYLKPTNEKISITKLYGFDIETSGDKNIFVMGSIYRDNEKYVFWNKKEMQDFILNNRNLRNSVLFATNLSFDFLVLFGDNYKMLSQFEFIIRGSDIINVTYKNKKSKYSVHFSDTMNFIKFGVETLGKILNIPKMKKPNFLGKKPKNETQRKQLELYNINDSKISYEFAEFLQKGFNKVGGNMKYTIASTSKSIFTNKYLKRWIKQPLKKDIKEIFKAYYGGRTECLQRGFIKDAFYYDINSLYPSVMEKYQYPDPNYLKYEKDKKLISELIKHYEGVALCKFICPKSLNIPLLPFRTEDKLLFPSGTFTNWQTFAEIRKAISLGYKVYPEECYYSTKTFNPFKEFVKDLYKTRMDLKNIGNPLELVYKIILNSFYGKLCQRIEQSKLYFVFSQEDKNIINKMFKENIERQEKGLSERYHIDTPDYITYKENGKIFHEPRIYYITDLDREVFPTFINPILGLYVTSYARLELYKLFERVQKLKGEIYYCDTDSLITDTELSTSSDLGDIKKEYDIKEGLLIKPKFYYLKSYDDKEIFKIKGIRGVKSYEQFYDIIKNGHYEYIKFTKFKESIRRGFAFNQKIPVYKELDLEDNKRIWKNKKINIDCLEKSIPIHYHE